VRFVIATSKLAQDHRVTKMDGQNAFS